MENKINIGENSLISDMISDKKGGENIFKCPICKKNSYTEIENEFTLPEYMAEIKKLIRVEVRTNAPSKFISENGVQINGMAEYIVLYVGMDDKTYGTTFESEYNMEESYDSSGFSDDIMLSCEIYPESVLTRVSSERKISIKCKLCAKIHAIAERPLNVGEDIPMSEHIQKLNKKISYYTQYKGESDEILLKGEIDLLGSDVKYICSDCKVFLESCEAMEGFVNCKGNVIVKSILCREGEDEIPYTLVKKIPFEEIIEINGAVNSDICCANGVCTGFITEAKADDGTEVFENQNKLSFTVKMILNAEVFRFNELSYVKDAYSTMFESENIMEKYSLPVVKSCMNTNFTFNASEDIVNTAFNPKTKDFRLLTMDALANANVSDLDYSEGKYTLSGKCRFNVIYTDAMSENPLDLTSNEIEIPFKYEFRADENGECKEKNPEEYEFNVCAVNPRARFDSEKVYLDCELLISGYVTENQTINAVSSMRLGEKLTEVKSGFTVCYPDSEDTLWSISKRYRAKLEDTAENNGISPENECDACGNLENIKYIIV